MENGDRIFALAVLVDGDEGAADADRGEGIEAVGEGGDGVVQAPIRRR